MKIITKFFHKYISLPLVIMMLSFEWLYAADSGDMSLKLTYLVMQVGVIIAAAWLGGRIFEKFKFPSVLGEIASGIIIGPYLLGSIPLLGLFPSGLFPAAPGFPVSTELYGIAAIASVVLLFFVGLETNVDMLLSFSVTGLAVGLGGVIVSFIVGNLTGILIAGYLFEAVQSFWDPVPLFFGVVASATSIGISARVLSENRKLDAPEGITIISAAVIDDVLGIVALSVVIGIVRSGDIIWGNIIALTLKSVLIWLGFTAAGIIFYRQISWFLKLFNDRVTISIISFACALLLSGIFEKSGLAMIIGAYVMGLSISKTDLSYVIQDNLEPLRKFFVPIFFCVTGMLIDIRLLSSPAVIYLGLLYSMTSILSKIFGGGLPAYLRGFSLHGAVTVGFGMVPRGEVALTIAGIGMASGILPPEAFSIVVLMTFVTAMTAPPLISYLTVSSKPSLKISPPVKTEHRELRFPIPNAETANLVLGKVISTFEGEGFYTHKIKLPGTLFQMRKEDTLISLYKRKNELVFECRSRDESFVYTLLFEVLSELEYVMKSIHESVDRRAVGNEIFSNPEPYEKAVRGFARVISPDSVSVSLKSSTKEEIIKELLELLVASGGLPSEQYSDALGALMEREKNMSTGMQYGIALPHARVGVAHLVSAFGLHPSGVDFNSLDKEPSKIFVLTLIPYSNSEPYLQYIAEVMKNLADADRRKSLLSSRSNKEMYKLLSHWMIGGN